MKVNLENFTDEDYTEDQDYVTVEDHDCINVDVTLAKVIYPVLKRFRDNTQSYPDIQSIDVEDLPDQDYESGLDLWKALLDEMLHAFYELSRHWEYDYYYDGRIDSPGFRIVDNNKFINNDVFSVDEFGIKMNHARIQFGLKLFAKYYQHLWS